MTDKDETKRLERATLDIEKLKVNYWSLWQELGEIRKEIEHLFFEIKHDNLEKSCILNAAHILHNRIKGGAFDLPKRWVLNRTFTYSGMFGPGPTPEEIKSAEETMSKYKPETEPAKTPIQKAEDLVEFYNKPEPAQECGCLDKAKLLDRLKVWMKTDSEEIKSALEEGDFTTAARYKASLTNHLHIEGLILWGKFDRAPCTPEPAPAETGEVIGFLPYYKDGESYIKVRLDDGRIEMFRAMPEEEWEREHTCRCSTANLVELLRARASLADGIDVTDLDAGEMLEIGGNQPATVIWIKKEDRS